MHTYRYLGPACRLDGVLQAWRLRAGDIRGRDGHPGGAGGGSIRYRVLSGERSAGV